MFHPDFVLQILHPILNENQPANSADLILVERSSQSKWRATLSRTNESLRIGVKLYVRGSLAIKGRFIHVVPMNGGKPIPFELSNEDISAGDYMVSRKIQG